MPKGNIEFVTKWSKNPQELVNRINKSNNTYLHNSGFPKRIFEAELRYGKFIHVNCGGSMKLNGIPIFEGVDKIAFLIK